MKTRFPVGSERETHTRIEGSCSKLSFSKLVDESVRYLVWALFLTRLSWLVTVIHSSRVDAPWGFCQGLGETEDRCLPPRLASDFEGGPYPCPPVLVGGCCSGGALKGPCTPGGTVDSTGLGTVDSTGLFSPSGLGDMSRQSSEAAGAGYEQSREKEWV